MIVYLRSDFCWELSFTWEHRAGWPRRRPKYPKPPPRKNTIKGLRPTNNPTKLSITRKVIKRPYLFWAVLTFSKNTHMETLGVFRVFIGGSLRSKPLSVSSALLSVTQCGLIEAEPEKYYKRSKNKMPGSSQKRWKPKSHQGFAEKNYLSWKKIQVCNLSLESIDSILVGLARICHSYHQQNGALPAISSPGTTPVPWRASCCRHGHHSCNWTTGGSKGHSDLLVLFL